MRCLEILQPAAFTASFLNALTTSNIYAPEFTKPTTRQAEIDDSWENIRSTIASTGEGEHLQALVTNRISLQDLPQFLADLPRQKKAQMFVLGVSVEAECAGLEDVGGRRGIARPAPTPFMPRQGGLLLCSRYRDTEFVVILSTLH